jgi:hypothetical protein
VCSIINSAYLYVLIQFFYQMAFPVKQVWTLDERLRIIEEVKKTHQRKEDVAERLGQPPSTLNRIIAKKKIREHAYVSGRGACDVWCAVCGRNYGQLGSGSCVEEVQGGGDDEEAEPEPVLSFTEALHAF